MFIMPSFKKSLIVEQFQGNYLKTALVGQSAIVSYALCISISVSCFCVVCNVEREVVFRNIPTLTNSAPLIVKICNLLLLYYFEAKNSKQRSFNVLFELVWVHYLYLLICGTIKLLFVLFAKP